MSVLPELGPPWAECLDPQRWTCWTPQGVECEVARWLVATVEMLKPSVVVDTGTYVGTSALHLGEGCRRNGFGHVWSQDIDGASLAIARQLLDDNGLADWVTLRESGNVAALCELLPGPVDLAFIDADVPFTPTRSAEMAAVLPFLSNSGVMLIHDTSPEWDIRGRVPLVPGVVTLRLPTPRGLTIARAT